MSCFWSQRAFEQILLSLVWRPPGKIGPSQFYSKMSISFEEVLKSSEEVQHECDWQRGQVWHAGESEPWLVKWSSPLFSVALWSPSGGPEPQWGVPAGPQATVSIDSGGLTAEHREDDAASQDHLYTASARSQATKDTQFYFLLVQYEQEWLTTKKNNLSLLLTPVLKRHCNKKRQKPS